MRWLSARHRRFAPVWRGTYAAIYTSVLNDAQIKKLSSVAPLDTQCLFDAGFHNSISYRIPSLITLKSGVVVAGADQRETIANDSPNSINFTIAAPSTPEPPGKTYKPCSATPGMAPRVPQ